MAFFIFPFTEEQFLLENKISISELVRTGREKMEMNRSEFAKASGISRTEVARIEDDVTHKPSAKTLFKLASIFNLRYETLLQLTNYLPATAEKFSLAAHYPGLKEKFQEDAAERFIRLIAAHPELMAEDLADAEKYIELLALARRTEGFYD